MKRRYFLVCGALVFAALVAAILSYPHLPERIPTHWNAHGEVDDHGPPWMVFVIGPGLMLVTTVVFALLPWLSPRRFGMETFLATYLRLMLLVVALCGYLFAVILVGALTGSIDMNRALLGGLAVVIALMGNLMGKVRRNFFLGIRTPWTLASERVWHATHRLAGRLMVLAGLGALVAVVLATPAWVPLAILGAGMLIPVVYSLVHYKRLQRRGELEAHQT